MLRAAVIERNKERRERVLAGLENLNMDIRGTAFSNASDYLEQLETDGSAYDILLLNTTLFNEGDGVQLAARVRSMNNKIMITFMSETDRYLRNAFDLLATGYLRYPFDMKELHNCISFYYHMSEPERRTSLMIKETGGNYRRIYARHIRYIESSNREILLHLDDGTVISGYMKMTEAEENLPSNQFFRCHQSYLVNFYFVDEQKRDNFKLGDDEIPVSRKYQTDAKEKYYNYVFDTME